MSRVKTTFNKSSSFLSGTNWTCILYDRLKDVEYRGSGNTKKEAKDNAWDEYYYYNNRRNRSSYYEESDSSTSSTAKSSRSLKNWEAEGLLGLVIIAITGLLFYWAYNLFQENRQYYWNPIGLGFKEHFGAPIGIIVMILSSIISLVGFYCIGVSIYHIRDDE